ncbi:MAG: VTT domain-containing protein [Actinomycetota bacterium]|nr:VTT domain-containing protein [Actinomycetota bacterium]
MKLLAATLLFGIGSAVIPVLNMEVYLVAVFAKMGHPSPLMLAVVGSVGQNVGKLAWYYAAQGVLNVPWLQRRLEDPRRQAGYDRWRSHIEGRPLLSGVVTFLSAAIGIPPFFVIAAVAGTLRMNVVVFFVAGLFGRVIFFWLLLSGAGLMLH